MSNRYQLFLVHGLHILAIGIIGFFVLKNIREDGAAVLFKALNQSFEKSDKQMRYSAQFLSEAIETEARAYFNDYTVQSYYHSKSATRLAETVMNKFKSGDLSPEAEQRLLLNYCDTLAIYFDKDPDVSAFYNAVLQPALRENLLCNLSNTNAAQRTVLRNCLTNNIFANYEVALYYLLQKVSAPYCGFDAYRPYLIPISGCLAAGEAITFIAFLGSYSTHEFHSNDRAWVNQQEATIHKGKAMFSTVYKTPGPQPLHIRIETHDLLTDSVRIFEKTYTVNVR
ncbi:MAG: hypothetical protein H6574_10170 [Lewinellaceae bacterium]|nr:hypothetical protein [Lewinellaceae bacterium]